MNGNVPTSEKAMIIGTLGYFILPLDVVPDIAPMVGYADDGGVLFFVIKKCSDYIDDDIINKVYITLDDWFGDVDYEEIKSFLK